MERDRRTSGMVVAPDLPGRCGWKKTLHCRHDEESSESAADPCHRRCSRKFRLLYGYGNRKWRQLWNRYDHAHARREASDRRPSADPGWVVDATHHGSAFRQRQLCLFHNDSFLALMWFDRNARERLCGRDRPLGRAKSKRCGGEIRPENLSRCLLPRSEGSATGFDRGRRDP